jgi:beta-lactamase class A
MQWRYNRRMRIRIRVALAAMLVIAVTAQAADISPLRKKVEQAVNRARGDVGVAVKHLESGTEILINADKKFPMASTYKLPILVEIYYQAAEGRFSLDDRVEVMPSDIHIGSGAMVALFDPPGVQLNIRNLINMAMRVSDNSAADILLNRVGPVNVTQRMKMLGLDSIRVDRSTLEMILDQSGLDYAQFGALPAREVRKLLDSIDASAAAKADDQFNKTDKDTATPADMNRLLEMLVKGEIVDRAASDEIIAILKECQTGTARIPGLLPKEVAIEVAHKSGTISGSINDTGIVLLPYEAGHLAITVFMKNTKATTAVRERVIADITNEAYEFFVNHYSKL